MLVRILILVIILFLIICGINCIAKNPTNSYNTEIENKKRSTNQKVRELKNYEWIHDFESDSGEFLGSLFIKPVNDSLFNSMRILNGSDTIYKIDYFDFWNPKGTDFDIRKNKTGFYGYTFRLIRNKYVVIGYYSNMGKNVADDQTLGWDENEKVFKIWITP